LTKSRVNGTALTQNLSNNDVTFYGITADDRSGFGVGSGDFNNDGIDDVIIGAIQAEGAGGTTNNEGETYIIYGPINESGEHALANANVTFYGVSTGDQSGWGTGSGDFNNDGIDDVIIGAIGAEGAGPSNAGETYIIYGPINDSGVFALANANVTFYGIDQTDSSGRSTGSGDFNNDGIDDVIIGAELAEGAGPNNAGETYIIYGPTNDTGVFNLSTANVTFYGVSTSDQSGYGVGSGDFNNDGIDDVIIGANNAEGAGGTTDSEGETYIIYGPINDSGVFNLSTANVTFYGIDTTDRSGAEVGSGDFNNDGIDDVIIGANNAEGAGGTTNNEGETYIIYGQNPSFASFSWHAIYFNPCSYC